MIEQEIAKMINDMLGMHRESSDYRNKNLTYDFGVDSLQLVELIVAIESHFNFSFLDDEFTLANMSDFNSLIALTSQKFTGGKN